MDKRKFTQKKTTSDDLFRQAMASKGEEKLFYWLISRALILKLYESGKISKSDSSVDDLPDGEVKLFLGNLQRSRFGEGVTPPVDQSAKEARKIFEEIA